MDDNIVAAIAVTCAVGLPIMGWIVSRVLAHQERMEMLRRGIVPPPNAKEMRRAMKYGWTPYTVQQNASNAYGYYQEFEAQQQLRKGMRVAFIGLALLVGFGFVGYHRDGSFVYGPWLLVGLIPLFVGLAQVISAVLSGASFAPPSARPRFGPDPSSGPTAPSGAQSGRTAPPGPAYGGWRPGPTPEIEKPASPPDYRS
jgi:hypothetical protein